MSSAADYINGIALVYYKAGANDSIADSATPVEVTEVTAAGEVEIAFDIATAKPLRVYLKVSLPELVGLAMRQEKDGTV